MSDYERAMELHRIHGWGYWRVAKALGISPYTVKEWINRGKKSKRSEHRHWDEQRYKGWYRGHQKNRGKERERARKRYYSTDKRYRENLKKHVKEYFMKVKESWYDGVIYSDLELRQISVNAEKIAAKNILPKEGFANIIPTSYNISRGNNFPFFDVLAEKNGKKCGIAITISRLHRARAIHGLSVLLKFLDMRYFACFVKPNLKQYILLEFPLDKIPTSLALTAKRLINLKNV